MPQDASFSDRLRWAEEQGLKNLQEKFSTADNMNKEAQTTLTYLLTAMGATFAYAFKGFENLEITLLVKCASLLCAYYTGLSIYLVARTFRLGAFPSPYQQPRNLIQDPEIPLDSVRQGELKNIDDRITASALWISRKATAINRVRFMLVVSPILFIGMLVIYIKSG